jgi:hypothetical protein
MAYHDMVGRGGLSNRLNCADGFECRDSQSPGNTKGHGKIARTGPTSTKSHEDLKASKDPLNPGGVLIIIQA